MSYHLYPISVLRRAVPLAACGLLTLAAPALAAPSAGVALRHTVADVPVSGRVTQDDGTPMPGVTVIVKGTNLGTSTNSDGVFSLNVPDGSTLIFSAVGFIKQEVAVSGSTSGISVKLQEDLQALSEVVVVGYGTQERGSVTGAVGSVSTEQIKAQPIADATQALQGRVSGVTVTANGGDPGGAAGTSVRIRGLTSAGNNAPLYVVDGFPLASGDESQLNAISPNDIESIDVLKDASATAIYGLRAANGVVIITTKHGKAGKANIQFDAYRGVQQVWRKLDFLNAEQYAVINNENRIAGGAPIVVDKLRDPASLGEGTNWQDLIFRRAKIQNYSLSATGGSDKARYAVSGSYFQQDGTIIGSHFERFTLRANGDIQVNKMLKIGNNLSLTHQSDRRVDAGGSEFGVISFASQIPATIPAYRPDGTWYEPLGSADNFVEENPLAVALIDNKKFNRNRAISTFYAELEPLKGLRFRTNVGVDLTFDEYNGFRPKLPNSQRYTLAGSTATMTHNTSYLIEHTLTYDKLFGKHQVTLLAGQSAQQFNSNYVSAGRAGYTRNDLQNINNGPLTPVPTNGGAIAPDSRLASFFGRVNYEYGGKYLLQGIIRRDGTSAFAPGKKSAIFPGVSAGWRISEEAFMKDQVVVSNLKLRGGWGKVGNALNANPFQYLYVINSGIQYPFGPNGTIGNGAAPTRLRNDNLRWENNIQTNVGLDVGLLDNRLEASFDVYKRKSPNLIAPVNPPLASGTYESVSTNAASAVNKGFDIALTSHNIRGEGDGLTWTTTLNFSHYTSKVESLGLGKPYDGYGSCSGVIVRYNVGQPFGAFYGYAADGLFQTPEDVRNHATQQQGSNSTNSTSPGDIRFKDINGDGVINADDRTYIGSPVPDFTYGITNTVSWKGFDLNVFIQGSQGNDVYNLNRFYTEGALYSNGSGITRVLSRWTGPGTSNDVPRAIANDPNQNLRVSSYFVEDGSYARLKLLTLGYTLPKSIMQHISASQIRVYVSAQNLVTLTKYTGYDPEVGASGIDRGVYPQPRVFLGGVNFGF